MLSPHPHMTGLPGQNYFFFTGRRQPSLSLRHTADRGIFADITRHSCTRSNGRAFAYCYRGHQLSVGTDKHIVADNGLKFIRTIVVAGNGSRADVNVIANFRIARKSDDQLSSLYPDALFFHLNEVTDVHLPATQHRGRRRANGPIVQAAARFASSTTVYGLISQSSPITLF